MAYVRIGIKNYDALIKMVEDAKKAPQKVMKELVQDAKKRVPGWVASDVTEVYGIKKNEITQRKIGSLKIVGNDIKSLKFIYAGRMLTPVHFSMSPKAPKVGSGYTLKASIIKGQRKNLGNVKKLTKKQRSELAKNFTRSGTQTSQRSPIMLMYTGNKQAGGTHYIPFQRKSTKRNDIEAIKTVSLPQMISSERTKDIIQRTINDGIEKRLEHHMQRYMMTKP